MNEGPSFKNSERLQHLRIPALMKNYPKRLQTINGKHAAVDDLWPLQRAESKSGREGRRSWTDKARKARLNVWEVGLIFLSLHEQRAILWKTKPDREGLTPRVKQD